MFFFLFFFCNVICPWVLHRSVRICDARYVYNFCYVSTELIGMMSSNVSLIFIAGLSALGNVVCPGLMRTTRYYVRFFIKVHRNDYIIILMSCV